ncbi:hypothetical protein IFR05_010706 [Cadophora sp. M221]|nr:hypothetical protein IFR05_010706 [Cadophora sp. M221]
MVVGPPDLEEQVPLPSGGRERAGHIQPHIPATGPAPVPATAQPAPAVQPEIANDAGNATNPPQVPAEIPATRILPNQAAPHTNGATTAPAVPPSRQPTGSILVHRPRKTFWSHCWSMKGPISLVIVYTVTSTIIGTSSDVNGPLARLGVTGGFLVLNILALLNNYALVAAGDKAWSSVQWGPLMKHGQNLTTFFALSTSSGVGGWLRIIFHGCHVPKRFVPGRRRSRNSATAPKAPKASILQSRLWGFGRVGFWLLVQFPGLIFMTKVNPVVDYRPTTWERLSGGIGEYNATQAATKAANGALLSGLTLNIIRDGTLTKSMPAVSQECSPSNNCTSYILPGGMKNMSPWKFLSLNGSALPAYITRKTPVYQLDFWDAGLIPWAEKDCTLFGFYQEEGNGTTGFQICMTPYNDHEILAVPLYFYNPLTTPFITRPARTKIATDAPKENYIDGSYAYEVNRLDISWWTVLTYMIVCGTILILILLVLALTVWNQVKETSDYPAVDFLKLKRETTMANGNTGTNGPRDDVTAVFVNCAAGESRDIVEASRGVRIVAGARARAQNTHSSHVV